MRYKEHGVKIFHLYIESCTSYAYLGDCTKVEHTLVVYARHVLKDVWNMLQCISDEEIEAVDGLFSVLQIGKVLKLGAELAPGLWENRWGKQRKCICVYTIKYP